MILIDPRSSITATTVVLTTEYVEAVSGGGQEGGKVGRRVTVLLLYWDWGISSMMEG